MGSRIRELEAALSSTQAQISPQPHPLIAETSKIPEVDAIASLINDDGDISPADDGEEEAAELIGAMSIGEQGQTRFHGVSTSSEVSINPLTSIMCFMTEVLLCSICRRYFR